MIPIRFASKSPIQRLRKEHKGNPKNHIQALEWVIIGMERQRDMVLYLLDRQHHILSRLQNHLKDLQ